MPARLKEAAFYPDRMIASVVQNAADEFRTQREQSRNLDVLEKDVDTWSGPDSQWEIDQRLGKGYYNFFDNTFISGRVTFGLRDRPEPQLVIDVAHHGLSMSRMHEVFSQEVPDELQVEELFRVSGDGSTQPRLRILSVNENTGTVEIGGRRRPAPRVLALVQLNYKPPGTEVGETRGRIVTRVRDQRDNRASRIVTLQPSVVDFGRMFAQGVHWTANQTLETQRWLFGR